MTNPPAAPAPAVLPPELDPRGPRPGRRRRARGRRSGGRRAARVLSWIAVVTAVSVLVTGVVAYGLFEHYTGRITRIDVFKGLVGKRPPTPAGKAVNYLLVGSDSREGATPEQLRREHTTFNPGQRSDTTILAHLSANRDKVLLISFPRDSYVDIPSCTDDKGRLRPAVKQKLNFAFSECGPAGIVSTIENLTNIHVDHYAEINFAGFQRMVDEVGGVDVCLPKAVKDPLSGLNLPAGVSHVGGEQGLAYVRARYFAGSGNDLGRIQRQQKFLGAMIRRATSAGVLLNPTKLLGFLNALTASVRTDPGLGFNDMRTLATKLRSLDPAKVTFVTVPVANETLDIGGNVGLALKLDEAGAQALFASVSGDGAIPGAKPAPTSAPNELVVAPSRISVQVLNGSGISGRGRIAAADLSRVGFRITGTVGSADATDYTDTIVRYGASRADSARTLAAAIPGAKLQQDDSLGAGLKLVVGRSYAGAQPVVLGSPSARPTAVTGAGGRTTGGGPAPVSPPETISAADDPCA